MWNESRDREREREKEKRHSYERTCYCHELWLKTIHYLLPFPDGNERLWHRYEVKN
jgi:hypothetical protein